MAVVVGPGRKFGVNGENETKPSGPTFICHPTDQTAATILISLGAMGIGANLALMAVILLRRPLRRSVFCSPSPDIKQQDLLKRLKKRQKIVFIYIAIELGLFSLYF